MATHQTTIRTTGHIVEAGLKQWLDREDSPEDFYQLVGLPRLCPDRDRLLETIEQASEYLFQYQHHKDKAIRDRARTFHRQIADARRTISDDSLWEKYDQKLIDHLQDLYRENPSFSRTAPDMNALGRWLALVQKVDSSRVDDLIQSWLSETPSDAEITVPQEDRETVSSAAQVATKSLPSPNVRKPVHLSESQVLGQPQTPSKDSGQILRVTNSDLSRKTPPAPQTLGKAVPPIPKQAVRHNSEPTPPPARNSKQRQPRNTSRNGAVPVPRNSVPDRRTKNTGVETPVLWIVMAAFLLAIAMGLVALAIAWASGAFESKPTRLRAAHSVGHAAIATHSTSGWVARPESAKGVVQRLHTFPNVSGSAAQSSRFDQIVLRESLQTTPSKLHGNRHQA